MKLTSAQAALLRAVRDGATLKIHRTLDGAKLYRLHPLAGAPTPLDRDLVDPLVQAGLLASNLKFPAATFLLTEEGVRQASRSIAPPPETC